MPNRYTDTDIWKKQKWFKKLPVLYKLAWRYLTDCCDHAGIWKIDIPELQDDLGEDIFDLKDFIIHCNKDFDKKTGKGISRQRIVQFNEDHIWITGFILFQYGKNGEVTENFGAARSAIRKLQDLGLYEQAIDLKYFKHVIPEKKQKKEDTPGHSGTLSDTPAPSDTIPDTKGKGLGKGYNTSTLGKTDTGELDSDNFKEEIPKKEIPSNPQDLTKKMMVIYRTAHPKYRGNLGADEMFCGQISLFIAESNGWSSESVTNGKMDDVLAEWEAAMAFVKNDKYWYSKTPSQFTDRHTWNNFHNTLNFNDNGSKNKFVAGRDKPNDKL